MDKAEELLNTLDVNDENLYPVSPEETDCVNVLKNVQNRRD